MRVTVSTPAKVLFEANVREVVLPGEDGELSVMDFHQPFLYRLRAGMMKLRGEWQRSPNSESRIRIKKGLAKMFKNELIVLIEN